MTAARPTEERASHWYWPDGRACYEMPKADGRGMRKTTLADAKKLGLLPSPTSLLKILARPQLEAWKIEQSVIACLSSPRRDGEELDAFVYRVLHVEREQDAERDAAADKGIALHDAIECALNDVEYDPELKPFIDPVLKEILPMGRVAFTERILVGNGHAGRTDCGLENDTHITICDFKGTAKIPTYAYDEHVMQVSSYCYSVGNTGDKRVRGAVVYIDRNNPGIVATHIVEGEELERAYKRFRLILEYWKLTNNIQ